MGAPGGTKDPDPLFIAGPFAIERKFENFYRHKFLSSKRKGKEEVKFPQHLINILRLALYLAHKLDQPYFRSSGKQSPNSTAGKKVTKPSLLSASCNTCSELFLVNWNAK